MIEVMATGNGGVVLQKVTNTINGEFVRFQYGIPGDASLMCEVSSEQEGLDAIAPLKLTVVDRNGDAVVWKITKLGKLVNYAYSITGSPDYYDTVKTLTEARQAIGKK